MHLTQSPWETINLDTPAPSQHNNHANLLQPPPYSGYASVFPNPTPSQLHGEEEEADDDDNDDDHTAFIRTPLFHPSKTANPYPHPYPYSFPYHRYSYHTFPPISPATTTTSTDSNNSNGSKMKDPGAEAEPCYFDTLDFSDYTDTFGGSGGGEEAETAQRIVRQGRQAVREGVAAVCMVFLVVVVLVVMGWAVAGAVGTVWGDSGKFVAVNVNGGSWGRGGSEKEGWAPCTAARPRFCRIVAGAGGQ